MIAAGYIRSSFGNVRRSLSSLVRTEVKDKIGFIYLSDKEKLNALTVPMGEQFMGAVKEMTALANAQEIRSCIVAGDGNFVCCHSF